MENQTELLEPYFFQQEIIRRFCDENNAALFLGMGTGKSLITSNLIRYKMNTHMEILNTVIFCPIIVLENWKRELLMSTRIPEHMIGVVMGSKAKRIKMIKNPQYKVLIINYEAARTTAIKQELMEFSPSIVVCDESHMIKSRTSSTFKAVKEIALSALYKYILTGTPITAGNAVDLWSQFNFLDNGETFGERFYSFQSKYFINKNAGWDHPKAFPLWIMNPSLEPEFKERLHSKSVFMETDECVDLPDVVSQEVDIPLTTEMKKHYDEVRKDLITWIDGQEDSPLVVTNALTKLLRLSEILSGYMKLSDDSIVRFKVNPRTDALMSLVEHSAPHKLIVYAIFRQNYKDIAEALDKKKIKYVEIHGSISAKQKLENVDTFNDMDNEVRVAIVNPVSGGVGINLKSAKYRTFYTRGHSMKDYLQAKARNERAGSIDIHKKIFHYDLVSKGTIDESILCSLKEKKKFATNLLEIKKLLT